MYCAGLLLFLFSFLFLFPCVLSQIINIVFNPVTGHYYQLIIPASPLTQSAASAAANTLYHLSQQGYLVTIDDATEASFLQPYFETQLSGYNSSVAPYPTAWTGAERPTGQYLWYWDAIGRVSAHFWNQASGANPNCTGYCNWALPYPGPNDYCSSFYLYNTGGYVGGTWKASPCTDLVDSYLVEYDSSQTCTTGYSYSTVSEFCVDIDECTDTPGICGSGYNCTNTIGSYECNDIDECVVTPDICGSGFTCENTNGSYLCNDINECLENATICPSGFSCQNTIGSYLCNDINECLNPNACPTGFLCNNTIGSYQCNDINECLVPTTCPFGSYCTNTIGSYFCTTLNYFIQSNLTGYVLDISGTDSGLPAVVNPRLTTNYTRQLWSLSPNGYITNLYTSLVLDINGGNLVSNTSVICYTKKPVSYADNQLWKYNTDTYHIVSLDALIVLDVQGSNTAAGTPVIVYAPKTTTIANQLWTFINVPS